MGIDLIMYLCLAASAGLSAVAALPALRGGDVILLPYVLVPQGALLGVRLLWLRRAEPLPASAATLVAAVVVGLVGAWAYHRAANSHNELSVLALFVVPPVLALTGVVMALVIYWLAR